jgi:4-hydroxyphenylacetate 3-monooxygenase
MPARTGTQFLDGLHDDRAIWLDGERIKDVRTDSLMPDREPLSAMRTLYPRFYPRMIDILRTIGGSELAMTLSQADLQGPLTGRLAPYFQGVNTSAEEHVQLIRLAWDVVGDSFGSRQLLYERFFSGDPIRNMAGRYLTYDATACKALVQRVLDRPKPFYS